MISHQRLLKLVSYRPSTGVFINIVRRGNINFGQICGNTHCRGYIEMQVDGQTYLAHHLAWFFMIGRWPEIAI